MGSKDGDRHLMDGGDEGVENPDSGVSCSICLDLVTDNGGRSRAKLQCGHEFHLDCIGSAFNMKGAMQCPNCRKVEKGQWLYANGSTHSFPEFSIDEWIPDEDPYDLNYPEMPFSVHWCPFGRLAGIHSSFEEVETPPTYHDQRGNHAIFAEHTAATSAAHSYVAYFRPITPASSHTNDGINDFNHQWNGPSGHNENLNRHNFPGINIQYHSWIHHFLPFSPVSSHINSADLNSVPPGMLRSTRGESDGVTRSRYFLHPLSFGQRSGHRTGSPFVPSIVPGHPGSNARTHERIQNSHGFQHQQPRGSPAMPTPIIPGIRRLDSSRGLPPVVAAPSQTDHPGGFYILPPSSSSGRTPHEAENYPQNPFQILSFNRELSGRLYHQSTGGSDSGNRPTGHWHRRWS